MNYDMELYSKQVEKLIVTEPKNRLMENVLGLGEEAGEVQGKVKEELKFSDDTVKSFFEEMKDFIMKYQLNTEVYTSMGRAGLDPNSNYGISTTSGWFIRQFEGEYNPVHVHPDSMVSCVGYLKLPEGIEDEWEEDYKDHHPAHGHIQFAYGTSAGYTNTNFMIKPQVGDFYIFPSQLFHCVYPFYTKGERRSFSMNLNFLEIILEEENK